MDGAAVGQNGDVNAVALPRDPTAVIGRRIVAWLVDIVIVIAFAIVAARGIVDLKRVEIPPDVQSTEACNQLQANLSVKTCFTLNNTAYYTDSNGAGGVLLGLPTLVGLLNSVVLTGLVGGSLGKLLLGLRVVRQDTGQICGIGKALVRWLLWVVDSFPYCFPLVGLITGLTTKGHRRVGDMAAGTLVVDKSDVGVHPSSVTGMTPGPYGPGSFAPTSPGGWPAPGSAPAPWGAPQGPPPSASEPPSTWGAPVAAPAAWPAPQSPPPVASTPEAAKPTENTAPADGPQWDPARKAYIHWDATAKHWLQWDDGAKQWKPIS
jgi:uncharacterized RDD family membrane protein YckC